MAPAITAVIINYNQGKYFEDCYLSTISQTFHDFELLIIDDCSTDHSVSEIKEVLKRNEFPHQLIVNQVNRGICANLNLALQEAKGSYFTFIASDDWGNEDRFQKMFEVAQEQTTPVVVYSDCKIVDEHKKPMHASYLKHYRPDLQAPPEGDVFMDLLKGNFIPAMCTLIRTDVLRAEGGFDESLKFEDYDMWLRLARKYSFRFAGGAEGAYRILQNSLIRRLGARKFEDGMEILLKHLDTDGEYLRQVKKNLRATCGGLYYTDSKKFRYYYNLLKKQDNLTLKLKIISLLQQAGVRGSRFKKL